MVDGYGLGGWGISEPWGSIVHSGPPAEVSLGDFEFSVVARSEGYKIRIKFSAPAVVDAPDWNRRLIILRKQGEWPQSWDDPDTEITVDDVFPTPGGYLIDQDELVQGQIYYYALFSQRTDGVWIHDRIYNRGSAYPYDRWGAAEYMFQSAPRGWRTEDVEVGGDYESFLTIFGALIDDIKTDCEHLLTLFEIDNIHDDLIWLLDKHIGWPTWHATGGLQRRKETTLAVDLYKILGKKRAYERLLEEISAWDVEVVEGWRYVMFSNGLFGSTTPDMTDPDTIRLMGRKEDILKYTNDSYGWHSVNGLAFFLSEIPGISGELTTLMLDRYREIIEWAKASYVNTSLKVIPVTEEQFPLATRVLDSYADIGWSYSETPYPVTIESDLGYTTADASLFISNALTSTTNTMADRTFHEALEYV